MRKKTIKKQKKMKKKKLKKKINSKSLYITLLTNVKDLV